ncbi:MAG: helix-turn-helix transcriptional regulator, partial [Oscillospiraceae bacterium]
MNLKSIREDKLKYTKEDFSALIGITVSELEKLEKTNAPSLPLLETISQKTGIDFNTLLAWKKPKPKALNVKDNWSRAKEAGESLSSFIKDTIADVALSPTQRAAFIDDLEKGIVANAAKPSLA